MSGDASPAAIGPALGEARFESAFGRRGAIYTACGVLPLAALAMSGGLLPDLRAVPELPAAALLVALPAIGIPVWLRMRYGRYLVAGGTLVLRRQWQTRRIPLASIVDVRRARGVSVFADFEDDFALGTEALEIRYGDQSAASAPRQLGVEPAAGRAFVSPRDETAFLAAIGQPATDA